MRERSNCSEQKRLILIPTLKVVLGILFYVSYLQPQPTTHNPQPTPNLKQPTDGEAVVPRPMPFFHDFYDHWIVIANR